MRTWILSIAISLLICACGKTDDSSKEKGNNSPEKTSANSSQSLNEIMRSEIIGVLKDYFEKKYGPAKRLLDSSRATYEYEIEKCQVRIEYNDKQSINSVELSNISNECTFDTKNIFLEGSADKLTYKDLVKLAIDWQADLSCYSFCGNAFDPNYGIYVKTPHVTQFIQFKATSDYSIASSAAHAVKDFFMKKYPDYDMVGDELGPINAIEYNQVWIDKFKDVKLTSLKFGYQLDKK